MRKINVVQVPSVKMEIEGNEVNRLELEVEDGQRLLFFVIKSDNVDETTMARLKETLSKVAAPAGVKKKAIVLMVDTDSDFEIYEESTPA